MHRIKFAAVISALLMSLGFVNFATTAEASSAKAGTACKKSGTTSAIAGVKFQCMKSGKYLLWIRSSKIIDFYDAPLLGGVDPITFENITSRVDDIAPSVWQNAQDVIAANMNLPGAKTPFVIYRSPNLKDSFYKDATTWMQRVNSLYANFDQPYKTYLYFTTGQDLESTYKEVSKRFENGYAQDIK